MHEHNDMPISSRTTVPTDVGSKPHTILDVARVLGLSKTTVSKAFTGSGRIAPATREAVLRAARDMNFELNPHAQRLSRGQSSNLVSLFCPGEHRGASVEKNRLVQQLLDAQGFEVPLYTSAPVGGDGGKGQADAVRRLRRLRPRAIVCFALLLMPPAIEELQAYQNEGGLLVSYDTPVPLSCDQVIFDRNDNTYQAAKYLIDKGHRKIGLLVMGNPKTELGSVAPRVAGFERAMCEHGIPTRADWLWHGGQWSEKDGATLAEKFLALPNDDRPTGMCIVNESVATAFMNRLLRAGIAIPEQVSIVSHDNLPIAENAIVPLTTVSNPTEEIARSVAHFVLSRLTEPQHPARRAVLCGKVIIRDSVAAPP